MKSQMSTDEKFMREAIKQAKKAYKKNEVPIGAVIVYNGRVIGKGYNQTEAFGDPTAHAEIAAIRKAAKNMGGWRLTECSLYVTVEPCLMCFGAAILARVSCVIYGVKEPKFGSVDHLRNLPRKLKVRSGILQDKCRDLLKEFFKQMRH